MIKEKYEISLWEDKLIPEVNNVPSHFEEEKIAVIGSNSMTADCRAIEPRLVENINGTHTFTFKMFYVYTDNYGQKYQNPFLNLLVNERKVKVLWKDVWYDFVIKNCQENSEDKSITYTCTDLFINELSKTGFDIVLDGELQNNQGTPVELAQYVLEGTDWTVDTLNSDIIKQEKEEPVYEVKLLNAVTAHNDTLNTTETIAAQENVLVFYNQLESYFSMETVSNVPINNFQFVYAASYSTDDNSQLVLNANCYSLNATISKNNNQFLVYESSTHIMTIAYQDGVSSKYRASRLVRSKVSIADPITGKYCYVYNKNGTNHKYYGFQSVEYNDPTVVNNLLVNSKNFTTTAGWDGEGLIFKLYPVYVDQTGATTLNSKSYLKLSNGKTYANLGLTQSSNFIPDGFIKGQKYIFRYKAVSDSSGNPNAGSYIHSGITPTITGISNSAIIEYFNIGTGSIAGDWTEFVCTCKTSIKRLDLYTNEVKLYLTVGNAIRWIEEVQFFPLYLDQNGNRMNPGEMDAQSVATTYYTYYDHTEAEALHITDPKDIVYTYKDTTPDPSMIEVVNENFEKIRSITAKQSNRFNILQTIAETFECWAQFIIDHDQETGKIIYINGVAQKRVIFKKDIGQEVGVGFIYGIDLKGIQRTIQSDQIVTKTIVSPNSNEFAPNGFCTIARSIENYPRTNFILNFDYYITQGLLNGGELNKDLYLSNTGIGYYYHLSALNKEYDSITEELTERESELLKQESYLTIYDGMITSIEQQIRDIESEVEASTGTNTWAKAVAYVNNNKTTDTKLTGQVATHDSLQKSLDSYRSMKTKMNTSITSLSTTIQTLKNRQDEIKISIKQKHLEFYTKYSRYIQEGSWISQDYIDDNLYYLDALSVAYTSSRPQISYNISVLRLSALEEFKNKVFHLGDISFVQDTEFFGYTRNTTDINSVVTPYKEKVLVAEVTSYFDEPEKDSFKVQNYKTQFEDLFQRITSTTQSLQYSSGEYARAASIVETDGTIKTESLQASFAINEQLVYSAKNDTVSWDSTGISVIDSANPNHQTKVTSGGVFITTDGGVTWKNAVRGEGVATQYLTSGNINTASINIMNGDYPTFRWDQDGINAYRFEESQQGGTNFYFNTAVRFDQFGLYGINNYEGDASNFNPSDEAFIWNSDYTRFGLTWEGFFLKDDQGRFTLKTNANDGTLWLDHALHIGTTENSGYLASIGYLDGLKGQTAPDSSIHEVVNINEKFKVYEDGSMIATDGTFSGTVYATDGRFEGEIVATSGTIGNVRIEDFTSAAYKVVITSSDGTTFKKRGSSYTPSQITLTATLYKGSQVIDNGVTYKWYANSVQVGTSRTYQIDAGTLGNDGVKVYRCDIDYTEQGG